MAESDDARVLLARAADDLDMLDGMIRVGLGTDAIFGFHAQQAVEKAAKAWLLAVGVVPSWTHNLHVLIEQLQERAPESAPLCKGLAQLTAFAVQFRYGPFELASAIDRADLARRVGAFVREAQKALDTAAG